jgi:hypothetical protein
MALRLREKLPLILKNSDSANQEQDSNLICVPSTAWKNAKLRECKDEAKLQPNKSFEEGSLARERTIDKATAIRNNLKMTVNEDAYKLEEELRPIIRYSLSSR